MNNNINRWMIIAGLLAAPFYITLIITLGVLEPGYNQLAMPMSILGGVPGTRGLIFNMGVAATGAMVIVFGVGLWRLLPTKITAKIGIALLVIGGLGLVGAGYFHCNEGCVNILKEPDLDGQIHTVVSLLAGMGTALAPFFIWASMRRSEKWKSFTRPTLVLAILANLPGITFWLSFATGYRLLSIEGLIQRLGFIVILIWIFYVTMKLLKQTSHKRIN